MDPETADTPTGPAAAGARDGADARDGPGRLFRADEAAHRQYHELMAAGELAP